VLILTPTEFTHANPGPAAVLDWVRSPNGQTLADHGSCAAALLPTDDDVVLVLPPRSVSWHRVACPKVSGARLRATLDGLLEERLLADTSELHFALEPGGKSGQTLWVAACDRTWLKSWLQTLDAAGRPVTRIVPGMAPLRGGDGEGTQALHWAHLQNGQAWLSSATAQGVSGVPLAEGTSLSGPDVSGDDRWWTEPAVATRIEHLVDRRVDLVALPAWLLHCAQADWNLAQFDLSLSSGARRGQRWRQSLREWRSAPVWRPVRWGLGALLLSLLIGLNALAWIERSTLAAKQQAITRTLQNTFPDIALVMDAPRQMQRALVGLQQASGTLSAADLEAVLAAVASAAPGAAPAAIDFTPGDAQLGGWTLPEPQLQAAAQALNQRGWQASVDGASLRVRPKAP
jgi:general secretion pathway protein L